MSADSKGLHRRSSLRGDLLSSRPLLCSACFLYVRMVSTLALAALQCSSALVLQQTRVRSRADVSQDMHVLPISDTPVNAAGSASSGPASPSQLESSIRSGGGTVGILYEGWHGFAADAMRTVSERFGGPQLVVEQVLRSNGALRLSDMLDKYNLSHSADGFVYHVTPQLGFYCLYRARPGETGLIPDCVNISGVTEQQAGWLSDALVDYVVVDNTNLPFLTPEADGKIISPSPRIRLRASCFFVLRLPCA